MSHEINNPLTNITLRAQSLLAGEKDPDRRKALEAINAQAFRAFEMLADLMLFAHPPAPQPASVDVIELLTEVVQQQAAVAREQRTSLVLSEPTAPLPLLNADCQQLTSALNALVKNALEAVRAGGEVRIYAAMSQVEPASVEFIVADNGPGIPAEIRRHLFDPFFSGREAGRGLGLGLCKVWRIAELHGGQVQVESEPGCGTSFRLRIPLAAEHNEPRVR